METSILTIGRVVCLIVIILIAGCSGNSGELSDDRQQLIESQRAEKDVSFREADYSPIPEPERTKFTGLKYFDYNGTFNVIAKIRKITPADTVTVLTNKDSDVRSMIRYGILEFNIGSKVCTLMALKYTGRTGAQYPNTLFVPFRDLTSGVETYDAGRYLDLEEVPGELEYALDFNLAYNPYCAYNESYSCPLTPVENYLDVRVEAGERTYNKHK